MDQRTEESIQDAISYFEQAIQQDSSYALGWAALAEAQGLLGGYGHVPMDSVLPGAWEAARRALALDSTLAEAHAAAGLLHIYAYEGPPGIRKLRQAIALKPSLAEGHRYLGFALGLLGQPKAVAHFRRSAELNPMTPEAHGDQGLVLLVRRRYEEALHQVRQAKAIEPEYHHYTHHLEVMALYHLGRLEEAVSAHRRGPTWRRNPTWHRATRALLYLASGDSTRARELQAELEEADAPFAAAWIHAAFGEVDAAFQALERIRTWNLFPSIYLRHEFPEVLRPLRNDPRYEELIRELNRQWGLNPDGSLPEDEDVPAGL